MKKVINSCNILSFLQLIIIKVNGIVFDVHSIPLSMHRDEGSARQLYSNQQLTNEIIDLSNNDSILSFL